MEEKAEREYHKAAFSLIALIGCCLMHPERMRVGHRGWSHVEMIWILPHL